MDCGAGGSTGPARAIVYGNRILNPNDVGGFTHGISVEKVDNAVVANNVAIENDGTGRSWSPALNINGSSNTVVHGNTVENVIRCVNTANGPGARTVYANNTFYEYDLGIIFQEATNPGVEDNLITGNTFESTVSGASAVKIDSYTHANVIGNQFVGHKGNTIQVGSASAALSPTSNPPSTRDNSPAGSVK